jgi:hypothetical protein
MITAKEFDTEFSKHEHKIQDDGFKRIRPRAYLDQDGFELRIITDKYGWTPDVGWAYLLRMSNTNKADAYGNISINDVRNAGLAHLLSSKAISVDEYLGSLVDAPSATKKLVEDTELWLPYYSMNDLRNVLDLTLAPCLDALAEWKRGYLTAGS